MTRYSSIQSSQNETPPPDNWRKVEIRYSLLAVLLSICTLIFTVYQDYQSKKEEIIVHSFGIDEKQKVRLVPFEEENSVVIYLMNRLLLTNTSSQTVSIIDSELEVDENGNGDFLAKSYTNFYTRDGEALDMPLILKAGESLEIKVESPVTMAKDTYAEIKASYKVKYNKELDYRELQSFNEIRSAAYLAEIDIYGNKETIKQSISENGNVVLYVNTDKVREEIYPIYKLTFKTVRSNYFEILYEDNMWNDESF